MPLICLSVHSSGNFCDRAILPNCLYDPSNAITFKLPRRDLFLFLSRVRENIMISASQQDSVLLIMRARQNTIRTVAPRVAGSKPVARPNYSSLLRKVNAVKRPLTFLNESAADA